MIQFCERLFWGFLFMLQLLLLHRIISPTLSVLLLYLESKLLTDLVITHPTTTKYFLNSFMKMLCNFKFPETITVQQNFNFHWSRNSLGTWQPCHLVGKWCWFNEIWTFNDQGHFIDRLWKVFLNINSR